MNEIRIDVTKQNADELALANHQTQLIFKFNHTMPGTAEYEALMRQVFPSMGDGSRVSTPLTAVSDLSLKQISLCRLLVE
ncbi:MAG: hypothetical protein K2G40_09760, partial [Muribaculaceae bacterium]|nr:hypothetical protein [Muribaculaceae bacterium]